MPKYPFTPKLLDAIPEELVELFRGLDLALLDQICSRFKISGQLNEVTVRDIRALRSHGIDLEEIKRAISETTETGMEKLESALDDVVERNQKYYSEMVDLAGVTKPERMVDEKDIRAIFDQTKGEYRNITQSMGYLVTLGGKKVLLPPAKVYQWGLDSALLQVESGAISYNQAISDAVRRLAERGLCVAYGKNGNILKNRVAYESGHVDQLDVAIRRAVMTGVNQINQRYREQSMDYLGTDLVETTAHLGARNIKGPLGFEAHSEWQGKVYRYGR